MTVNKPQHPVDEFLLEISRDIYAEADLPEKARAQTSITLRRRLRGTSKSDLLGCFSADERLNGQWLGDGPEKSLLMNMYSFQIVKPVIRANQSAMVQARVECTVTPASKRLAGVASIGKGIYKYWNNHPDYWSNNLENQINQQCQTDPGYFIHSYQDPDAEALIDIEVDEYSDQPLEKPGEYACAVCGSEGPLFREQMGQATNGQVPCLKCEHWAEIIEEPSESAVPQFQGKTKHPAGNIVQEVISAFQIRIDERKTKNGNIRKAQWLEHHYLEDEDELQARVPYFDLGAPTEWSYPLKWEYALETGTDLFLKTWATSQISRRRPQHEVRKIYLRPARYRNYVAPKDFDLDRGDRRIATNRRGEPILSLKAGETLIDKFPKGFWFVVCNDRLLPLMEACDLRDEWAYGGYLNDSAAFWYQSASELNELQRAANNLWTIDVQHRESGSIATTVFDRNFFNPEDFEQQLAPTKEGSFIEQGDTITNHYASVTPPNMNGAMAGIGFVREIIGDVGGPQPAAIGAPAKGEPYAAQRLQKQQSLGLLTPSQQSKAEVKAQVLLQHLKFVQKYKPIEWFQYIGTLYGEEWKQQDIEAFLNANLDMDITVWYKEGSEVPASLIEQELKYRQFILDIGQVANLTENPKLLRPEMLSQYAELSGVNYDLENVEADRRLAESRYEKFRVWLEANPDTGMPEEELVEIALADRSLFPWEGETHSTHIEMYGDKIRALLARPDPPYPLITACVQMVKRHEQGVVAAMQTQSASEVEGHAPELAAQVAAAQAQAQQEQQLAQQEAAAKAAEVEAANQRQAMADQAKAEREAALHSHQAQLKAAELAVKMEDIRARVPPEQDPERDPRELVAETVDYVDLPPTAQSVILGDIGLPTTGTKDVNQATLQKAQIAAAKTARAQASRSNGASK